MISANVVAQVMTVTQVTQITQLSTRESGEEGGGCCRHNQDDFSAILNSFSGGQSDGIMANSPFFPGMQGGSGNNNSTSEMINFFAGMISDQEGAGSQQAPYDFIQSLTSTQKTTFQSFEYMRLTSSGGGVSFEQAQAIMDRVSEAIGNQGGEWRSVGQESPWMFPPSNAPQGVEEAWDNAAEGATEADKMLVSGLFMGLALGEKVADGQVSDGVDPVAGVDESSEALLSWELDQYWQQVETLLGLIDRALEKAPDRESEVQGAKGLLGRFLDELEEINQT